MGPFDGAPDADSVEDTSLFSRSRAAASAAARGVRAPAGPTRFVGDAGSSTMRERGVVGLARHSRDGEMGAPTCAAGRSDCGTCASGVEGTPTRRLRWLSDERRGGGLVVVDSGAGTRAFLPRSGDLGGVMGLVDRLFDGDPCAASEIGAEGESEGGRGGRATSWAAAGPGGAKVDERRLTSLAGASAVRTSTYSERRLGGSADRSLRGEVGERTVDCDETLLAGRGSGSAGALEALLPPVVDKTDCGGAGA